MPEVASTLAPILQRKLRGGNHGLTLRYHEVAQPLAHNPTIDVVAFAPDGSVAFAAPRPPPLDLVPLMEVMGPWFTRGTRHSSEIEAPESPVLEESSNTFHTNQMSDNIRIQCQAYCTAAPPKGFTDFLQDAPICNWFVYDGMPEAGNTTGACRRLPAQ